MRKEIIVFAATMERGEEISITAVAKDRNYVILSLPNGSKNTVNKAELIEAIKSIDEFYEQNQPNTENTVENTTDDVEYGEQ